MSRARRIPHDEGDAISIESVLTIMVVLILLRLLFFIPLVNIDRAHLEKAQVDTYWKQLSEWIQTRENDTVDVKPYIHAFELDGNKIYKTNSGKKWYIEALSPSGDIKVIELDDKTYISCFVKGSNAVATYQYGEMHWSETEHEWFTTNNSVDYGEKEFTTAMQTTFRKWTRDTRGF